MEFNNPPPVRMVDSHPGTLATVHIFLRVGPENQIAAALMQAEDQDAVILGVFNSPLEEAEWWGSPPALWCVAPRHGICWSGCEKTRWRKQKALQRRWAQLGICAGV